MEFEQLFSLQFHYIQNYAKNKLAAARLVQMRILDKFSVDSRAIKYSMTTLSLNDSHREPRWTSIISLRFMHHRTQMADQNV